MTLRAVDVEKVPGTFSTLARLMLNELGMPRKNLVRTSEYPYHVYSRTNNREDFPLPMEEVWQVFCKYIQQATSTYSIKIHVFVLMKNHFHAIVSTPDSDLGESMNYLLREVSRTLGSKSGRINHIFGGRYKWCLIMDDAYLLHVIRYIFQNPIHTGSVSRIENYPYSSIHSWISPKSNDGFSSFEEWMPENILGLGKFPLLEWLNSPMTEKHREGLKRALRRRMFHIPIRMSKRYVVPFEQATEVVVRGF